MFLKKSISNGKIYLSFVQGYRENGKSKQKTIEKIGYLEDLKKIYDDPISHFKSIAKERNSDLEATRSIEILSNQRLADQCSLRKNLGYVIPKHIYALLDITAFFQNKQRQIKQKYNLNQIFSLLVFNRFLFPASKKKAYEEKDVFFDSFSFSLDDVYRSLNWFSKYSKQLQAHVYSRVKKLVPISTQIGYYDVTNFYFEIPYNDEDEYDKDGNILKKGTRKKGPSKEHRKTPIIQMGLLMDENGIPMTFNTFSGNESEKTSILPAIRRLKKDFGMERVIAVADRGLNTSDNKAFLSGVNDDDSEGHDGYVYGQSVIGADKEFRKWVLDKNNYKITKELDENGEEITFIHKSRIFAKTIQLKNQAGNRTLTMPIYQKQLAYYSKKYAEKQRKDRNRVLEKAKDLIKNPRKYTQATSYGSTGYVKNLSFVKDTGEIADGKNLSLDLKKIAEEEKYDGYYSIVTSEKNLSDKEIRDIYRGLWKIEESFKIIKSEFKTRPIHVRLDNHIEAHFLICFITLIIMRLLESMTNHQFSVKEIRESLTNYGCSYLEQNYYLFDYRDDFLRIAEKIFNLDLGKKTMTLSEIKNILKTTK
ncbi:IS1634 family transposase [Herbivorax sp. ANBcel31]|uniref:IS1634 family transposase n=1 Tax=Herbivorax sp. ANBcel31 TaxID=3069754 RepID=UPI0027AEA0A7|nr:IS1634 family transposase [Herbivorax sp. ANBcel31]MDQ2088219.1 IS1634 family transposase [Herbivorax sp. ANBcel31]